MGGRGLKGTVRNRVCERVGTGFIAASATWRKELFAWSQRNSAYIPREHGGKAYHVETRPLEHIEMAGEAFAALVTDVELRNYEGGRTPPPPKRTYRIVTSSHMQVR